MICSRRFFVAKSAVGGLIFLTLPRTIMMSEHESASEIDEIKNNLMPLIETFVENSEGSLALDCVSLMEIPEKYREFYDSDPTARFLFSCFFDQSSQHLGAFESVTPDVLAFEFEEIEGSPAFIKNRLFLFGVRNGDNFVFCGNDRRIYCLNIGFEPEKWRDDARCWDSFKQFAGFVEQDIRVCFGDEALDK